MYVNIHLYTYTKALHKQQRPCEHTQTKRKELKTADESSWKWCTSPFVTEVPYICIIHIHAHTTTHTHKRTPTCTRILAVGDN